RGGPGRLTGAWWRARGRWRGRGGEGGPAAAGFWRPPERRRGRPHKRRGLSAHGRGGRGLATLWARQNPAGVAGRATTLAAVTARLKGRRRAAAAVIDRAAGFAEARPEIVAVALVGSYARGRPRQGSDLDPLLRTARPRPLPP